MNDIADRLERARGRAGRSIRSLQMALHENRVPGSSYANVHSIFKGKAAPSFEFLDAAAAELGVRRAWLAFDEGPMTDADAAAEAGELPETYDRLIKAVPELEGLSPVVTGALAHAVIRLEDTLRRVQVPVDADDYEEMARLVWRLVQSPFVAWATVVGRTPEVNPWDLSEYAMGILHAILGSLRVAFPEGLSAKDMEKWRPYAPEQED